MEKNPGEQQIVIGALKSGKVSRKSWIEKEREVDVFDIKADVVKNLIELGISENDIHVSDNTKQRYHPEDLALSLLNQKRDQN